MTYIEVTEEMLRAAAVSVGHLSSRQCCDRDLVWATAYRAMRALQSPAEEARFDTDRNLRGEALHHAIVAWSTIPQLKNGAVTDVIGTARKFEAYLRGQSSPEPT